MVITFTSRTLTIWQWVKVMGLQVLFDMCELCRGYLLCIRFQSADNLGILSILLGKYQVLQ